MASMRPIYYKGCELVATQIGAYTNWSKLKMEEQIYCLAVIHECSSNSSIPVYFTSRLNVERELCMVPYAKTNWRKCIPSYFLISKHNFLLWSLTTNLKAEVRNRRRRVFLACGYAASRLARLRSARHGEVRSRDRRPPSRANTGAGASQQQSAGWKL